MEKDMETNVKTTESVGTDGETQGNEPTKNNEKLFTQEEVNNIVKKRLYERKKQDQQNAEDYSKKDKDIKERESSVTIRENRVACHEMVVENGYPKELLDILDTSDPELFKDHAEKLSKLYRAEPQKIDVPRVYPGTKSSSYLHKSETTPFANTRHIPKQY